MRPLPESGSATVLAAASSGVLVGLLSLLIAIAVAMGVRLETETAADAAALAAVGSALTGEDACAAAERLAAANGGHLVSCRCPVFDGTPFVATVVVARTIELPLLGERTVEIARSAEYRPGS